jgi:hypothetical protein
MNDTLKNEFLNQGYCFLESVIPPLELKAVCRSVHDDVMQNSQLPPPSGYVPGFLRFNQTLAPYAASEQVVSFIESLLGPHVRISMFSGMVNGPGIPRGELHADWPYNQGGAARIPAPYPDCLMHVGTMWMLSDFTDEGGGTIVVPGSHRRQDHPRKDGPIQPVIPYPGETRLVGKAGTVAVFDARLWHAVAPNVTGQPRVSAVVRYAPWWLNVNPLRPGTAERREIVEANHGQDSEVPPLPRAVFEKLAPAVRKLVSHAVEERMQ